MKTFEPRYRLVRYGQATKVEKPSRQQRTCPPIEHTSITPAPTGAKAIYKHCDERGRLTMTQASNARTGRRSSGVRPRSRARRRPRSKRVLLNLDDHDRVLVAGMESVLWFGWWFITTFFTMDFGVAAGILNHRVNLRGNA